MAKDIVAQWHKAKARLEEAKLIEGDLRTRVVDSMLAGTQARSKTFEFADEKYTAAVSVYYSIPKAEVLEIKRKLSKKDFKKVFGVSYSVRSGAISELGGTEKKLVEQHISAKDVYAITKK